MTAPRTAVITAVRGRHQHLRLQQAGIAAAAPGIDLRCLVAIDDAAIRSIASVGTEVIDCPATGTGLPMARARNVGARWALEHDAELLIFLDVDCVPDAAMIGRYIDAHQHVRDALLAGPVTYLPPSPGGYRLAELPTLVNPHPARPNPPGGAVMREWNYDLFWSLSFAVSSLTWQRIGGFCEDYVGYGGEDTDFAAVAALRGVPLYWVGGAHAYHQFHPVSDPPVEHLHAIVANARTFRRRWGRWPMIGWLDAFERAGLIRLCINEIALLPHGHGDPDQSASAPS
ncbi:galactosyltransferase-related protein [Candidatus Mycobacterium wuenschmannii]|uniref:Galactosyltransferase-related protein n=1 Tax=Candidatus Mycobacterium wuenschmannii TaxID=3027808 RepID=A0ABY8W0L0_9MYCO|nr:galactosyltransferase-related protein [Candidatus Mycobacterium wuenschmannii]WIM88886.1 galactosyltransferase-related protein [Candidatus Mycobacterium wuenschmannii]